MAGECHNHRKLRLFGFGLLQQGFFGINIPENKMQGVDLVAMIHILEGEPTEGRLEKELKNLIHDNWTFEVKKLDKFDYSASFPDKVSLESYVKLSSSELPIFNYRVHVSKATTDPKSSLPLHSVWVKIFNLPDGALDEGIVKKVASLVGKPIVVDELRVCLV
jgi:hypothetical protein